VARTLPGDVLPKGMDPQAPRLKPEPLTLAEVNYAGAIREALAGLPIRVRVLSCEIRERAGAPPEVLLHLTVDRKEDDA